MKEKEEIRSLIERIVEMLESASMAELRIIYKFVVGISE